VVFDLLYHAGLCLMREPLSRREALAEVCAQLAVPEVLCWPAVSGAGTVFYYKVVAAGQEGVLAKLLTSGYRPGKRSSAWKKSNQELERNGIQANIVNSLVKLFRIAARSPPCAQYELLTHCFTMNGCHPNSMRRSENTMLRL
jgi:hypothetical protein